jgi:hypothetical protein
LVQKEKEDLEEISSELELVDEEEKVPYVKPHLRPCCKRVADDEV